MHDLCYGVTPGKINKSDIPKVASPTYLFKLESWCDIVP